MRPESHANSGAAGKTQRANTAFDWLPWHIIDRILLPAAFFLIAFVAALTLWQLLMDHRQAEIRGETREQASFIKSKMESELRARILPLGGLAARWSTRDGRAANSAEMESDADRVMSSHPTYQAIEWVDPDFHVRWVNTPRGAAQTVAAADFSANVDAVSALRSAAAAHSTIVSRPVELNRADLKTAERGLLVCVPVYANGRLSGFLVGAFGYKELISSIIDDVARGYWIAFYDGNEEIYNEGVRPTAQDTQWVETTDIRFQQLTWRADVWPKPGTVSNALSILPQATFIGGMLRAGLLGFSVFLAETSRLHAKGVAATNRELQKEIAGREQAEQALREAQKMEAVGQLAGGVAHDFNNLLMVIQGHALMSLNRTGADGTLRRELAEILGATDRASSLTRRLLAFSRKQVLQLHVLDLNTLVSQSKELLSPVLGKDINLWIELDPELGHVKVDAAQIEQVIMNLVFNARDAMPKGGALTIRTANAELDEEWVRGHAGAQAGPHVLLSVRDTGHGMDQETLTHIFEPFFTTKDRTKGTGLGLATVYGTVRQSGGCITVSRKVGEGTTFQIYLPRVEDPVEVTEAPAAAPEPARGAETILVVEDDDAVRRMTREFLKIKGYTVIEARSAAEAIQFIERDAAPIDLVLTDVLMPGMKGRELVERLAEIRVGLKVLYMSAYTE